MIFLSILSKPHLVFNNNVESILLKSELDTRMMILVISVEKNYFYSKQINIKK